MLTSHIISKFRKEAPINIGKSNTSWGGLEKPNFLEKLFLIKRFWTCFSNSVFHFNRYSVILHMSSLQSIIYYNLHFQQYFNDCFFMKVKFEWHWASLPFPSGGWLNTWKLTIVPKETKVGLDVCSQKIFI